MWKTTLLRRLFRDEVGATAVEYGLILAMVVLAMLGALSEVASETKKKWDKVETDSAKATGF